MKIIQKKIDKNFKKRFKNTFYFSNDIRKFVLLLGKGNYPYEFTDDWEKFNETSLPEKEEFYDNLIIKDIANSDHSHPKRICKNFEIKIFR